MNCDRFIALLDDFYDGTLDPALRNACDVHLGECRRCQAELARMKRVARAAAALPRELAPMRDLWPGIATRLSLRHAATEPHRAWRYALAATILLTVGGMAALVFRVPGPPAGLAVAVPADAPAAADPRGRAAFVAHLAAGEGTMAPETRAVVIRNLQIIERAMREIETAVERDPNDPNLRALLTIVHQQESALIEETQRITVKTAKRTDI